MESELYKFFALLRGRRPLPFVDCVLRGSYQHRAPTDRFRRFRRAIRRHRDQQLNATLKVGLTSQFWVSRDLPLHNFALALRLLFLCKHSWRRVDACEDRQKCNAKPRPHTVSLPTSDRLQR